MTSFMHKIDSAVPRLILLWLSLELSGNGLAAVGKRIVHSTQNRPGTLSEMKDRGWAHRSTEEHLGESLDG